MSRFTNKNCEKQQNTSNKKKRLRIVIFLMIISLLLIWIVYTNKYYHEGEVAKEIITTSQITDDKSLDINPDLVVTNTKDYISFEVAPNDGCSSDIGFVFYPGGKVAPEAYAPLMAEIASRGIVCVVPLMPENLAILNKNAAADLELNTLFPDVMEWYLGGHSLGGVMVSSFALEHPEEYAGIALFGSYTTADFSDSNIPFLCMYGSEDGVLNLDAYNKNKVNLSKNYTEVVIAGGCHSFFGDYGLQRGDGTPTITKEEQWKFVTDTTVKWMIGE